MLVMLLIVLLLGSVGWTFLQTREFGKDMREGLNDSLDEAKVLTAEALHAYKKRVRPQIVELAWLVVISLLLATVSIVAAVPSNGLRIKFLVLAIFPLFGAAAVVRAMGYWPHIKAGWRRLRTPLTDAEKAAQKADSEAFQAARKAKWEAELATLEDERRKELTVFGAVKVSALALLIPGFIVMLAGCYTHDWAIPTVGVNLVLGGLAVAYVYASIMGAFAVKAVELTEGSLKLILQSCKLVASIFGQPDLAKFIESKLEFAREEDFLPNIDRAFSVILVGLAPYLALTSLFHDEHVLPLVAVIPTSVWLSQRVLKLVGIDITGRQQRSALLFETIVMIGVVLFIVRVLAKPLLPKEVYQALVDFKNECWSVVQTTFEVSSRAIRAGKGYLAGMLALLAPLYLMVRDRTDAQGNPRAAWTRMSKGNHWIFRLTAAVAGCAFIGFLWTGIVKQPMLAVIDDAKQATFGRGEADAPTWYTSWEVDPTKPADPAKPAVRLSWQPGWCNGLDPSRARIVVFRRPVDSQVQVSLPRQSDPEAVAQYLSNARNFVDRDVGPGDEFNYWVACAPDGVVAPAINSLRRSKEVTVRIPATAPTSTAATPSPSASASAGHAKKGSAAPSKKSAPRPCQGDECQTLLQGSADLCAQVSGCGN